MSVLKTMVAGICLSIATFGLSTASKATLIGTDVDVFLSVGGTTVISQTVSVTAPSSGANGSFGGVDYSVIMPDGLPGSDGSSFTFIPFKFGFTPEFRSDVILTLSSLSPGGAVTGITQIGGFAGGVTSFTADSVTVNWASIEVGLPTYHFDIETASVAVPEPGALMIVGLGLAGIGLSRRKHQA